MLARRARERAARVAAEHVLLHGDKRAAVASRTGLVGGNYHERSARGAGPVTAAAGESSVILLAPPSLFRGRINGDEEGTSAVYDSPADG